MRTEFFICEEHSQVYDLWLERGDSGLAVCHVDFHCDMRGLLIDRKRGKARFVNRSVPHIGACDPGSFLSHAIMRGVVSKVRWIHDDFGGRKYDIFTVKYECDLTSILHRWLPGREVDIDFAERTFAEWTGCSPGEHLDIDWDGIAFAGYDRAKIRTIMDDVLGKVDARNIPRVYLTLSPDYCHPDRALFHEFIARMEEKLGAEAVHLPPYRPEPGLNWFWRKCQKVDAKIDAGLRRIGLF